MTILKLIIWIIQHSKKIIIYAAIYCTVVYYGYSIYRITSLKKEVNEQHQKVIEQTNKYEALASNFTLTNLVIESLNKQIDATNRSYQNAQIEIANNKKIIDHTNIITKQWMQLALGLKRQVSNLPDASKPINAQNSIYGFVQPSLAASGINTRITECDRLKIRNDLLIDFINQSSINYSKLIN